MHCLKPETHHRLDLEAWPVRQKHTARRRRQFDGHLSSVAKGAERGYENRRRIQEVTRIAESSQENRCLKCPGRCCTENLINLCGHDVWVIARELKMHPAEFVGLAQTEEKGPYNFRLDNSEKAYYLVLNMKELPDGRRRCMFGLDSPDGSVHCSIYPSRPIACRAYPLAVSEGEIVVKPWAFCPDGAWSTRHLDLSYWQKELQRHTMEFCIYAFLIAVWHADVRKQPEPRVPRFRAFFEYLTGAYQRLEPARAAVPETAWPRIWRRWHSFAARGVNPLFSEAGSIAKTTMWHLWVRSIQKAGLEARRSPGYGTDPEGTAGERSLTQGAA